MGLFHIPRNHDVYSIKSVADVFPRDAARNCDKKVQRVWESWLEVFDCIRDQHSKLLVRMVQASADFVEATLADDFWTSLHVIANAFVH